MRRRLISTSVRAASVLIASAATAAAGAALPATVAEALAGAKIPEAALVALVEEVGTGREHLAVQADRPVNPASLMKLLTTFAGLELLGPAYRWTTPVWIDGRVDDHGVLDGNLVIKGSGDPTLVLERLWLLLRRVRQAGVRDIRGDIVLDRSAFVLPPFDAEAFDGEPWRPSNVGPDALLLNYRSLTFTFTPDARAGTARVSADMPLAGVTIDARVALAPGPCSDWRRALQADFTDPARVRFTGTFAAACATQTWPVAAAEPGRYDARALAGLWREVGGTLGGRVREGSAPASPPSFETRSAPLAEVIRDINKYSNNLMAQQLFLTLALAQRGAGTPPLAREVLHDWAATRFGAALTEGLVVDNGSGLSRDGRVSARLLGRLLQAVWASPLMPELLASLPLSGTDGTLLRQRSAVGVAHLKTGSLRDVNAIAGDVLAASGRHYVVVAIVNHPNAGAGRAALDALVDWVAADAPE